MKKLLLILSISLMSVSGYAFEQMIGVSGGATMATSKTYHSLVTKYTEGNPPYDVVKQWKDETDAKNNGYNANVEYQLRFNYSRMDKTINNFWVLGVGYTYETLSVDSKYQTLESFDMVMHNPYIIGMVTFFSGRNLKVRGGVQVGQASNTSDFYSYKTISKDIVLDVEYPMNKKFLFFSRLNYNVDAGKDAKFDTDLEIDEAMRHPNTDILSNHIKLNPKESLLRLNFGIRYRI